MRRSTLLHCWAMFMTGCLVICIEVQIIQDREYVRLKAELISYRLGEELHLEQERRAWEAAVQPLFENGKNVGYSRTPEGVKSILLKKEGAWRKCHQRNRERILAEDHRF